MNNYFRVPEEIFNVNINDDYFFMIADGHGMVNTGIYDKDYLLFRKTDSPTVGSIVLAKVDGEIMCRRYFKEGRKIRLRRENGIDLDLIVNDCTIEGELVSIVRNVKVGA